MPSLFDMLGQTWPARLAKSAYGAVTLPGDVYAGRVDPLSDEGIGRSADLGGLVMGGTYAGAPRGAMGSGPTRPPLPMDEASRMARAAEQGYTIDAYKGQNPYYWDSLPEYTGMGKVIAGTENRVPREITEGKGGGFYTSDPETANRFATLLSTGGAVFPSKLKFDKPLVIDAKGKPAAAFQFEGIAREHNTVDDLKAFKSAFDKGHDGVILRNTKDEGTIYVPRGGEQVRSRFAKFDPANVGKSGLLLGGAGLTIGRQTYGDEE